MPAPITQEFEVHHPEVEKIMKDIGKMIGPLMPKGFGFTLMVYSFGEGGSMFYISNAERDDMLKAMGEFIEKQGRK